MYLYENLARHVPIAQTLDAASNLRAQTRMTTLASEQRLIVPGHDPDVFARFPTPATASRAFADARIGERRHDAAQSASRRRIRWVAGRLTPRWSIARLEVERGAQQRDV